MIHSQRPVHFPFHLDVFLVQLVEVRMIQRVLGGDTVLGTVEEELLQEVHSKVIEVIRDILGIWNLMPSGEGLVPILEAADTGPNFFARCSQLPKDFV